MKRYAPPPLSRPRIYLGQIPKGYPGTRRTVEHMRALIRAGVKDFYVRQKAIDVLLEKRVQAKDYLGEIRALFEWVQANIRYTKDPFRLEVLHSPRRMLELRAGGLRRRGDPAGRDAGSHRPSRPAGPHRAGSTSAPALQPRLRGGPSPGPLDTAGRDNVASDGLGAPGPRETGDSF